MFQKLIFKPRSKSNNHCIKDEAKNKKKKKNKAEKDSEDPKILDDREKLEREEDRSGDERVNTTEARQGETLEERQASCEEDRKIDEDGSEIEVETFDGGAETNDQGGDGGTEQERVKETIVPDQEGLKENGELLENKEGQNETTAVVETEGKTKDDKDVAEAAAVIENGVETDAEKDEGEENVIKCKAEEPAGVEVIATEVPVDSPAAPTDQSPQE